MQHGAILCFRRIYGVRRLTNREQETWGGLIGPCLLFCATGCDGVAGVCSDPLSSNGHSARIVEHVLPRGQIKSGRSFGGRSGCWEAFHEAEANTSGGT